MNSHDKRPIDTVNAARWAWVLGVAGLLPFIVPALLAVRGDTQWLFAQQTYGACIVAFLGAIHWGPAINGSAPKPALLLAWGVVPSLLAWAALVWDVQHTGLWLSAALLLTLAADYALARFHAWPTFYLRLRTVLTVLASLSLLAPRW